MFNNLFFFFFQIVDWNWNVWLCYRQEIRTSTSSMTSVPKPLKFLRPHYGTLKAYYETMAESDLKVLWFMWFGAAFTWGNDVVFWFLIELSFLNPEVLSGHIISFGPYNVCWRGEGKH